MVIPQIKEKNAGSVIHSPRLIGPPKFQLVVHTKVEILFARVVRGA